MHKLHWLVAAVGLALMAGGCTGRSGNFEECRFDEDCFADEICDVGVCVPDNTYGFCVDTVDCEDPRDLCYEVDIPEIGTFGTMCTGECGSDAECEPKLDFGGVCYAIERDAVFLCYQQCDFDADCFRSSVCEEVFLTSGLRDFICVPNN